MAAIDITNAGGGGGGGATQYLRITGAPGEIDATLRQVEDQAGDLSIFWLSLTEAQFTGSFISKTNNVWWKGFDAANNPRLEMYHNSQGIWLDNLSAPTIGPNTPLTEEFIFRTYDATNTALQKALVIKKGGQISLRKDDFYTTQNVAVINTQTPASNWSIAIVPGGTGAFMLAAPDGTTTGGNARGLLAVDLQMSRTAANQVASANTSFIGAGSGNRNNSNSSFIGSGVSNTITNNNQLIQGDFIGAGNNNVINLSNGKNVIVGGTNNTIDNFSQNDFIGGGLGNYIAGGVDYSVITGGQSNTNSAIRSVINGGQTNTTSGIFATTNGGNNNTSSGQYSSILGGQNGTASASFSAILGGLRGNAYLYGQKAHASGRFSIDGDAQGSEAILRLVDGFTDAQTKEIYLDGSSLRITGPTNSAMTVNIDIVAIVTAISGTATGVTVGDMFSQNEICAYKNIGGTGTVVGSHSIHKLHDASMAACDTAFATTGAALQVNFLGPNFAGGGTVTLRIVAKARIVETRY
jgi:hypothetical protein